jgi:hypothetical protein
MKTWATSPPAFTPCDTAISETPDRVIIAFSPTLQLSRNCTLDLELGLEQAATKLSLIYMNWWR